MSEIKEDSLLILRDIETLVEAASDIRVHGKFPPGIKIWEKSFRHNSGDFETLGLKEGKTITGGVYHPEEFYDSGEDKTKGLY